MWCSIAPMPRLNGISIAQEKENNMYRVYVYSSLVRKSALYSMQAASYDGAIAVAKNQIIEGETGLYAIVRKPGNPWVLWDSRREKNISS